MAETLHGLYTLRRPTGLFLIRERVQGLVIDAGRMSGVQSPLSWAAEVRRAWTWRWRLESFAEIDIAYIPTVFWYYTTDQ